MQVYYSVIILKLTNSILDHNEMLDRLGLDLDSVMIIHMGGMYGDKPAALERFKKNYVNLSDKVKRRLVLENDEVSFSIRIFPLGK